MHRFVKNGRCRIVLLLAALVFGSVGLAPTARADNTPPPLPSAGSHNIVIVQNDVDGTTAMRGQVKLGRAPGPDVGPANLAVAINTCASHCQSFAVALQVNLVNSHPTTFAPDNVAVAANGGCNGCTAVAVALQYNIGVDDPNDVPPRVNQLIVAMRQELVQIDNSDMPLNKRIDGLNAVIGQFQDLAGDLIASRDVEVSPEKAPAPPAAPTQTTAPASTSPATPAPSPSPNPQPSPAATPSTSPEPSPSPT